jgi:hypothetical protein
MIPAWIFSEKSGPEFVNSERKENGPKKISPSVLVAIGRILADSRGASEMLLLEFLPILLERLVVVLKTCFPRGMASEASLGRPSEC